MDIKEHYKLNRELLDNILEVYDIPKEQYHNMTWLNSNIEHYMKPLGNDFVKAINLIHKLSPIPLTRLHSINYEE